jgi:CysZ protein
MKFITDFFKGIRFFLQSSGLLFTKRFRLFLIYPILAKLIFWSIAIFGIVTLNSWLKENFQEILMMKGIPENGHWLSAAKNVLNPHTAFVSGLISILISFLIFFFLSIVNKYLLLILLSPVISIISEITEEEVKGNRFVFRPIKFLKDILRGCIISVRNMLVEYIFFFLGFLLLLIPFTGIFLFGIYQIFLLFLSWYFFGFSLIDYSCERHGFGLRHSLTMIRDHKGIACGIGFMYWILITPPIIGDWIGICFAPVMGAIGSTLAFLSFTKS